MFHGRKRGKGLIAAIFAFLVACLCLPAEGAARRVLIVHSFGNAAPPFTTHSTAFETELTSTIGEPVDLDEVSLDVARYASLDMEEALVDLLRARQSKWQPDIVVPVGAPAGVFVAKHRERLFPASTPIVYTGMDKSRLPPGTLDRNAAFVGESFDIRGWVDDILQIAPDTQNIAVVIGDSPLERVWTDVMKKEFAVYDGPVKFTWFNDLSLEEILRRVKELPPHSFILHILMMRDASGVTHDGDEVLRKMHAVSNSPISGIFQHQLGLGIVGGRLYQGEQEGIEAARIAIRILRGEPASSFKPMIIGPLPPRYDWRELRRWKIDERLLPPASTVLFQTPTVWTRYRLWIIGALTVVAVQAILLSALILNRLWLRRAARSLWESEARITLAAEAARLGVWELNTATDEMWVSEQVRELFDLAPGGPVNRASFESRVHPEDRASRAAVIERAIRGEGDFEVEYRILLRDQTVRWISGRGRRMTDAAGHPTRLLGVSMDVTERKSAAIARERAEEDVRQQREQIELLARAGLLGEMMASIAHELRQPLASIVANGGAGTRFIDGGAADIQELRAIFADIESDGRRAGGIIHGLRNGIKKGESVRGRIDLNHVVSHVVLMVRPESLRYSCQIRTSLAEHLPPVYADPIQIQQVLINLVTNAFHAMSESSAGRGTVELTTRMNPEGAVEIVVRDYGPGIPPESQARLFEQFYTTKNDGLGMGLPIVRSIVEAHGGTIVAVNVEGGGASFTVCLPANVSKSPIN